MTQPVKVQAFAPMIPAVDDHLLELGQAAYAENSFLLNGRIGGAPAGVPVHTLADPLAQYAFRIPFGDASVRSIPDSRWLEFRNPNTMVVRSPVTGQTDPRFYWADGQNPPGYTTFQRIVDGDPRLELGVPAPSVPPTVVPDGSGVGLADTRTYVYSWVSVYGEEGQPSPPTTATGKVDDVWDLTLTAPTAAEMENRELATVRIYRTVVDANGVPNIYLVIEQPIVTTVFADDVPSDVVVLNPLLESYDYEMPPADLEGMVPMPNGMIVGWRANEIWFCEPYLPHAWPTKYTLGVESEIIGIGPWGQSAVILCIGQPYTITGIHPEQMALAKIQPLEPCTSKGSIVGTPDGIMYASPNGLILVTPTGGRNITENMILKEQFPRMVNIDNLHAAWFMGGYFSFGGVSDEVFQADAFQMETETVDGAFQQADFTGSYNGSWINLRQGSAGFTWFMSAEPTYNVMQDIWTGEVMLIRGGKVVHLDMTKPVPRLRYKWRSKLFQFDYKENWGAVRVFFEQPAGGPPETVTLFRWYVDGVLKFTQQLVDRRNTLRLPSGFKTDTFQFEIEGEFDIINVQLAKTPRLLRQV